MTQEGQRKKNIESVAYPKQFFYPKLCAPKKSLIFELSNNNKLIMQGKSKVSVVAITPDVNTCECCGKTGLKHTVLVVFGDGGQYHYGVTCAQNAAKYANHDEAQGVKRQIQMRLRELRELEKRAWAPSREVLGSMGLLEYSDEYKGMIVPRKYAKLQNRIIADILDAMNDKYVLSDVDKEAIEAKYKKEQGV